MMKNFYWKTIQRKNNKKIKMIKKKKKSNKFKKNSQYLNL